MKCSGYIVVWVCVCLMVFFMGRTESMYDGNSFFFAEGVKEVSYSGYIVPLSGEEVREEVTLNIRAVHEFAESELFSIMIESLDVEDSFDQISIDSGNLGYYFVTNNIIYRLKLSAEDENWAQIDEKIIRRLVDEKESFLDEWDIVCSEEEWVYSDGEWHQSVKASGERRIYHLYSDYVGGTRYYEYIVWEKGEGIVYYKSGSGNMLMHIEFGSEI